MLVWQSVGLLVALVWFARLTLLGRALRARRVLAEGCGAEPVRDGPHVSVIVAAKDEEQVIEGCIRSLLAQDYSNFEIIAIDDRSNDRTGAILRQLETESGGRLRTVGVRELPEGWSGKCHAVAAGIRHATGSWLYFTDADCTCTSRQLLSLAVQEALRSQASFLSITPVHELRSVWERIVQPACSLALIIWFQPAKVNDPRTKAAYANGASMLIERRCYESIGGHETVRSSLNEDVALARRAKAAGFTLRVVENDNLYRVRMYGTFREAWRGWTRIFSGCLAPIRRMGAAIAFVSVFSVLPWASVVTAAWWWARVHGSGLPDAPHPRAALVIWSVAACCQLLVLIRLYGVLRMGRWWALTYPLGALVTLAMLFNARMKAWGIGAVRWRGGVYHHAGERSSNPIRARGSKVQARPVEEVAVDV